MTRKNFSKAIIVARIKHATKDGVIYCEKCGLPCKRFDIDHDNPDGLTGEPTFENARLLCEPCHAEKTKKDVAAIAKAKRREARHVGAVRPKGQIRSAGFPPKPDNPDRITKTALPPRAMFEDVR